MRILMISSYLPYPLFSGGQVRLYNLIKELSVKHEITLICEKRSNQSDEDIHEVEKICKKVMTVERRKQWSISNILKSGFSLHSFLVTGHTHHEMRQEIMDELVREDYDLIHIETFYVMQNVPETHLPLVLAEHNIEYLVYKRYIDKVPLPIRPLLAVDVAKLKREEEKSWERSSEIVAVSNDDRNEMQKNGLTPYLVANGVNVEEFSLKDIKKSLAQKEKKVLFIGDFKWIQNRDTLTFIIKEIWPLIDSQFSVKLWVVGRHIPDSLKSLTDDPDIVFDEESSSKPTAEIFQEAAILLSPIRVGGGTSYKILESMSCGTPVVTMQMSADSIGARDGEDLLVGQDAKELAEKTTLLLQQNKEYEKISKKGRKLIEQKYSWKEIAKELEKVYEKV